MLSVEELQWLRASLEEVDRLLAGLADFGSFPDLITHDDPQVQSLVERTVVSVRDARLLTAEMLANLDPAAPAALDTGAAETDPDLPEPSAASAPPLRVEPPAHLEQITMANPTGMRELVLIADHDAEALAEIEQMLTAEDYRVLGVRDGFEAISIYARLWAAIDLVILDFSLPGMSGDLVFDELQAINPRVAAVVSSGFTHPQKLKQMLAQGLSGFLPKPYERERLIHQIQQVLAHRPATGR
jgi:CheY-like chemotaxis protein